MRRTDTVAARRIDVGGHALAVDSRGSGPPHLVFLHGLADTHAIWSRVAPALAEGAQVLLVDQRGHGGSDAPPGPYRREDLAADVRALLDRRGIERAVLVGHSLGGVVAMTTALAHPARIAGLVLLGTASECSPRAARWYEALARAAETDGLAGLARAIFGTGSTRTIAGDPQGLAHVTRCLASLADDPLTPKLAALTCPVHLLVGENDPMGVGASVIIERQVPHATLEVVPGRGHWLHVDAPELVVAAIGRVLPACG